MSKSRAHVRSLTLWNNGSVCIDDGGKGQSSLYRLPVIIIVIFISHLFLGLITMGPFLPRAFPLTLTRTTLSSWLQTLTSSTMWAEESTRRGATVAMRPATNWE